MKIGGDEDCLGSIAFDPEGTLFSMSGQRCPRCKKITIAYSGILRNCDVCKTSIPSYIATARCAQCNWDACMPCRSSSDSKGSWKRLHLNVSSSACWNQVDSTITSQPPCIRFDKAGQMYTLSTGRLRKHTPNGTVQQDQGLLLSLAFH